MKSNIQRMQMRAVDNVSVYAVHEMAPRRRCLIYVNGLLASTTAASWRFR